ncbi:MAG TPA: acyl-CoA dehydrogenase family protein, partial [Streptosporangiaceae bacterium]
ESFAAVLYTEPDAGSDLGSLTTSAVPAEGGYRISGTKLFSLKSRFADLGLCAARLPTPGPKYAGITLFLIDLRAPGVTVRLLPSIAQEQFHAVELEEVWAGPDAVLGGAGDGWAVLARALPYERTGIDLAARAGRWYRLARPAGDPAVDPAAELENAGRHGARAQAARLLAWRAANTVASGHVDEVAIAVAKWYCGEIAAEMAQWLFERHGLGTADQVAAEAGRAFLEAPGLTLSGGTSEMMLQLVAGYLLGADTTEG